MEIKIAVDAMGGDNAPGEIVRGCALALPEFPVSLTLVGKTDVINAELGRNKLDLSRVTVAEAPEVIGFDESPTAALRQKKGSSLAVGLGLLKDGAAGAFVSAGSTGALLAGATLSVGRIKGVERPVLATLLPCGNPTGVGCGYVLLIDCGANVDCKPSYLAQFAQMGSLYAENMLGVKSPRVGLVNVGTEREKGSALVKEAYALLESSGLNFTGNAEASDIPRGKIDVAVCDGFTGNVILKFAEGFSKAMMSEIKGTLMSSVPGKLGGLLAGSSFKKIKKKFDPAEVGGAPFLGLNALVVKAHGGSDANAIRNAIRQCCLFIEKDLTKKMENNINHGGSAPKPPQGASAP